MIRRGVALACVALVLAGCSPVADNRIAEQQRPQVESDMIPAGQLAGHSEPIDPESTRLLGTEDGLDYFVGSTDTAICLIVITDEGPTLGCGSGLPVKIAMNGVFNAELWPTDDADHDLGGHWVGEHLWLADRP